MSTELALVELSGQVIDAVGLFTTQRARVEVLIATAVTVSENASQIPLINMATSFIQAQTSFINYIGQRP
jgi:hypothetical protein